MTDEEPDLELNVAGTLAFCNWSDEAFPEAKEGEGDIPKAGHSDFLWLVLDGSPHELASLAMEVAMSERGQLAPALARSIQNSSDLHSLIELEKKIPAQTLNLRAFALALARRIESLLDDETRTTHVTRAERATLLNNLALRLNDLAQQDQALKAAEKGALEAARAADADPTLLPLRATLLNTLEELLGQSGRIPEALAAANDAVRIYALLLQHELTEYRPRLALSLKHRSDLLAKMGETALQAALSDAVDAVRIYRQLLADAEHLEHGTSTESSKVDESFQKAAELARSMEFGLATALTSCANRLLALNRDPEALLAAEETDRLLTPLRADNPDRFREAHAASLINLACCLMANEMWTDALEKAKAAADGCRILVELDPDRFSPDLEMTTDMISEIKNHLPLANGSKDY